jgi:peptidoglycan/LPS O-acetylase OafA/YrhL
MDPRPQLPFAEPKANVYFPNLNALRLIAAAAVVVHHVELTKHTLGLPSLAYVAAISAMGPLGVVLFFVLSGFLITYLLLVEERTTGSISIGRFYMRRILRIWPLYYLVVTLGLFVLPRIGALQQTGGGIDGDFPAKALMMLGFLPNIVLVLYAPLPYISQAWSVGSEEQFYLIWPWIIRRNGLRYWRLLATIMVYGALLLCLFLARKWFNSSSVRAFAGLLGTLSIDCMAIGGIAAVAYLRREHILSTLFDRRLQLIVYAVLLAMLGMGFTLPNRLHDHIYAPLFAFVILNLACNPRTIVTLEFSPLNYLGKISYGLYMYHVIAIAITFKLLSVWHMEGVVAAQYAGTLVLTIAMATVSYHAFEHPILKKKVAFSVVASGDLALETRNPDYRSPQV